MLTVSCLGTPSILLRMPSPLTETFTQVSCFSGYHSPLIFILLEMWFWLQGFQTKCFLQLCSHFSNLTLYTEISAKLKCLIKNQCLNWFDSSYILHETWKTENFSNTWYQLWCLCHFDFWANWCNRRELNPSSFLDTWIQNQIWILDWPVSLPAIFPLYSGVICIILQLCIRSVHLVRSSLELKAVKRKIFHIVPVLDLILFTFKSMRLQCKHLAYMKADLFGDAITLEINESIQMYFQLQKWGSLQSSWLRIFKEALYVFSVSSVSLSIK